MRPGWGTILSESRFEVAQIRGDSLFLIKDSFSSFQTQRKKSFRKSFFLEIREGRCLIVHFSDGPLPTFLTTYALDHHAPCVASVFMHLACMSKHALLIVGMNWWPYAGHSSRAPDIAERLAICYGHLRAIFKTHFLGDFLVRHLI